MEPAVTLGARVRVRLPYPHRCHVHDDGTIPVDGAVGQVVSIAEHDHGIGVVFDLWHRGTRWSDWFRPSELEAVEQ